MQADYGISHPDLSRGRAVAWRIIMGEYNMITIRNHVEWIGQASEWFCPKWGIAGKLLQFICEDMKKQGILTLYLVTDHTSFYERYGWEFLCMVQGDGEEELTRMYVHHDKI